MRYYQCDKYPIEFVVSENIDKHFDSHNHVRHYVISMVMQGAVTVDFPRAMSQADASASIWRMPRGSNTPSACCGVFDLQNREMACRGGDVFIIPPYAVHSVRQGRDARLLSMCIGTAFIEATDIKTAEGIFRDLLRNAVEQDIFGKEQQEKLLASVRTVYRLRDNGRKEMDAGIKILADKITSHPEQELPIETLAADIFVSKYHLIRKFKSSIGMTPHQFCIQNRIRKSQRLLDEEKTIGRIAAEMGFYDQSHFDRAFRRVVGISPSEYVHSQKQIAQGT